MKKLMIVMLLVFSTFAYADHIDEIVNGNLLAGKKQTRADLEGKVILFEYWGTN